MVFIIFLLSAIITVIAAIKLAQYADTLSVETSLGGLFVGTILLAGATSLPEVTTSLAAIAIDSPDIAVGNVFGSNLFNLFILAVVDLFYRKKQMLNQVNDEHFYSAIVGILLALCAFLSITLKINYTLLGLGIDSLIIIIIYGLGITFISKLETGEKTTKVQLNQEYEKTNKQLTGQASIKRISLNFTMAAIIILITGSVLSITGDQIAVITGLGKSFVGSFFIAITTSLPELVALVSAVKFKNYNLAVGTILGSNMFNMLIISGADLFYKNGALLAKVSSVHQITISAVVILSCIIILQLRGKSSQTAFKYSLPSLVLILAYLFSTYLIFMTA